MAELTKIPGLLTSTLLNYETFVIEDNDITNKKFVETLNKWSNYYTKAELQGDGTSQVHWNNLTNAPTVFGAGSGLIGNTGNLDLGNNITKNTTIGSATDNFNFNILNYESTQHYEGTNQYGDLSGVYIQCDGTSTKVEISAFYTDGTTSEQSIIIEPYHEWIQVKDEFGATGFIYDDDYSTAGHLFNNWLPNWKYVKDYVDGVSGSSSRIENTATTSYLEFGTSGADEYISGYSVRTGDSAILRLDSATISPAFVVNAQGSISINNLRALSILDSNVMVGDSISTDVEKIDADRNVGVGVHTLFDLTSGDDNVAVGYYTADDLTLGSDNVAIGSYALLNVLTTNGHIAIGGNAGRGATGGNTVNIGFESQGGGLGSINIGYKAGNLSTATYSVIVGYNAGSDGSLSGGGNILIGANSGINLTTGIDNIFLGRYSGAYETGSDKLIISNITAAEQVNEATARTKAILYGVMNPTTASQTLQINAALHIFDTATIISKDGSDNITFTDTVTGTKTLAQLASGGTGSSNKIENTATTSYLQFGTSGADEYLTGHFTQTGTDSILKLEDTDDTVIYDLNARGSIFNNSVRVFAAWTTNHNVMIGDYAASDVQPTGATHNVAIGRYCLPALTSGDYNIGIGYASGQAITIGTRNISIGNYALQVVTEGEDNIGIGRNTGHAVTTEDFNIFIGYQAGYYSTGSNKFYIGTNRGTDEATGKNAALLYGVTSDTTADQTLQINAKLQLSATTTYLDVDGSDNLTFTDAVSDTKTLAELYERRVFTSDFSEQTSSTAINNTSIYHKIYVGKGKSVSKVKIMLNGSTTTNTITVKLYTGAGAEITDAVATLTPTSNSDLHVLIGNLTSSITISDDTFYWVGVHQATGGGASICNRATRSDANWNKGEAAVLASSVPAGTASAVRLCVELI